jgi:hypothetical protein
MSNTERGFIALARGVLDHPVVGARKPYSDFEAWVWLLLEAVWKPRRVRATNGRTVGFLDLKRGQLSYSHSFLRKAWGWSSEKRVRTFLYRLETDGQIDRHTEHLQTVITICNYERYQNPEAAKSEHAAPQTDAQRTGKGPEEEQSNKVTIDEGEREERGQPRKYSFESGVIRLNERDFGNWQNAFPHLDLRAELVGMTGWAGTQQNWFNAVSGLLAKRNRDQAVRLEQARASGRSPVPKHLEGII